jgi:charged multivesicular body protein 4A/B
VTLTGAVALLKKRKLYQAEQEKISQVKMTLETQAIHLESATSTADAFQAMSAGNKTMQKIRKDMGGVENVDDLMVDIQEEMQMAEEVNTALGQGIDPMMGAMDDDELMMELEELQQSDLNARFDSAQLGKGNRMSYMLPQQPVSALSRKDDEDYRRLQAELAM